MVVDFGRVNESCLSAFGQDFMFTHSQSGESEILSGILESGVQLEQQVPGDGSVYALLWIKAGALSISPEKGDQILSGTTIYTILRIESDAGGGIRLLLRQG
jgi:hypothetical protein